MRLAVVGSSKLRHRAGVPSRAETIIEEHIALYHPTTIVSGGADGIDTIAATVAHRLGLDVIEYLPVTRRWHPHGYKERNRLIAENCDRLLRIRDASSRTYGSGYTADYAEHLGVPVVRITI